MDNSTPPLESGVTRDLTVTLSESGPETGAAVTVTDLRGSTYWLIGTIGGPDPMMLGPSIQYELTNTTFYKPADPEPRSIRDARNRDTPCPECGVQMDVEYTPPEPPADIIGDLSAFPDDQPVLILTSDSSVIPTDQIDDWVHLGTQSDNEREQMPGTFVCPNCGHETTDFPRHEIQKMVNHSVASPSMEESLGLAAGGGKDANNFRDNIEAGFVPQPSALSYEGLFYDYYFETATGARSDEDSDALFTPTYSGAVTTHPLTGETEQYLSVGLDSSLTVADFERKQLNVVAVLDVSGSMSSPFDQYYYDQHGVRREVEEQSSDTKIVAATKALCALTEQLDLNDRLGIILYNSTADVAKPIRRIGDTDMHAIRRHIRDVQAGGGTNMGAGFSAARDLLAPFEGDVPESVENRVIFMTDAMPNVGTTDGDDLVSHVESAAQDGIHTTFVGMGIDTNAELVDALSGVHGANHYFVHSVEEFERRFGDEFDYMVTPLVYDLSLHLETEGYELEDVYGSPNADTATGEVMHVSTLFPSPTEDGQSRGGIIITQLTNNSSTGTVELVASWTERDGTSHNQRVSVDFPSEPESFDHDGIRKAIVLTRYAKTLRTWAGRLHGINGDEDPGVDDWQLQKPRGEHERGSIPLSVPPTFVEQFEQLTEYLESERDVLGDETLDQELELLNQLRNTAPTRA